MTAQPIIYLTTTARRTGGPGLIRIVILALLVAALLSVSAESFCADSLTFRLDAPALEKSAAKPVENAQQSSQSVPAKQEQTTKTATIGVVGTVREAAGIFELRSAKSRRYITVMPQTPLAIVKDADGWYGVLMVNGKTGWINSKHVNLTGYELVAKQPLGELTSRGGDPQRFGSATGLIKTALGYSGVRYVFGGNDPANGIDCSEFLRLVFSQYGVNLPRTTREQAEVGANVPFDQLQPGDRLYFACNHSYIDHCGIYAGNGYFVHCSHSRHGVGWTTSATISTGKGWSQPRGRSSEVY